MRKQREIKDRVGRIGDGRLTNGKGAGGGYQGYRESDRQLEERKRGEGRWKLEETLIH